MRFELDGRVAPLPSANDARALQCNATRRTPARCCACNFCAHVCSFFAKPSLCPRCECAGNLCGDCLGEGGSRRRRQPCLLMEDSDERQAMNPNMTSNLMLEPRMRIPNLEGGNSTVSLAPNSAPTSQLRSDAFPDLAPNPLPNAPPDLAPNSNVNRRLNSNPTPQNLTSPGMLTPPPTPPTDRLRTHQLIPNQASPHQPSIPRTHDQHPDEHPDEHPDQHPDEHPDEHPDQHPDQDPDQDPELPMETAVTPSPLPLMASPISASISSCGTKPSSLLNLALPRPTASHLSARNPRPLVLPPKTSRLRDFTEGLANSYAAAEPADAAKAAAKAEAAEAAAATPEGEHTAGRGVSPPPVWKQQPMRLSPPTLTLPLPLARGGYRSLP